MRHKVTLGDAPFLHAPFCPLFCMPLFRTHRKIDSESRQTIPNLNCNYTFPINLAPMLVSNQSEKCNYNPYLTQINKITLVNLINKLRLFHCMSYKKYFPDNDIFSVIHINFILHYFKYLNEGFIYVYICYYFDLELCWHN